MVAAGGVLAIVPARGGSRSIPGKNLATLGGHPLLAWSIAAARHARTVGRVIVSTDDTRIAKAAVRYGAEVPFLRPPDLATDTMTDLPVFQHALRWLEREEGWLPDIVVQLRPTSPLRSPALVDMAVRALAGNASADSARSVAPPAQNPFKMWRAGEDGGLVPLVSCNLPEPYNQPRQALPDVFWQTGHVDVLRPRTLFDLDSMSGSVILPVPVDERYAVDIDTFAQLEQAESVVRGGTLDLVRPDPWLHLARFRALVLDFDGVLTDDRVYVFEDGREAVACRRGDGMGISRLRRAGVHVAVLSSETNAVVGARCQKLGIPWAQALDDKATALGLLADGLGLSLDEVIYIGNDRNDLECIRLAGLGVAVADAHPSARHAADWVLSRPGGAGAVRELCDVLIEARNHGDAEAGEESSDWHANGGRWPPGLRGGRSRDQS